MSIVDRDRLQGQDLYEVVEMLAQQLLQAHGQMRMAAECLVNNRLDEALLHCHSLARVRRNALIQAGVDIEIV